MKLYGYKDEGLSPEAIGPFEVAEITLVANANELRKIAKFIESEEDGMEKIGRNWEHEHLGDKCKEFRTSPHFVTANPEI
jgi:hypothetical protein